MFLNYIFVVVRPSIYCPKNLFCIDLFIVNKFLDINIPTERIGVIIVNFVK